MTVVSSLSFLQEVHLFVFFFCLVKVLSRGKAQGSSNAITELSIFCPAGSESLFSELSTITISSFNYDSVTHFLETEMPGTYLVF